MLDDWRDIRFNGSVPPSAPRRREIVLISYWYPPAVGAAAERIHSFARYLPRHGWRVRVVTADAPGPRFEPEGVTVYPVADRIAPRRRTFADYDPHARASAWKRFLRELVFPDRFRFWQKRAVPVLRSVMAENLPDVVLASFPPASAVLAGMAACELSGARLVLDFRDRWFGPGGYEPVSKRNRLAHQTLEKAAVAASGGIITVSDAMAEAIVSEHGYPRERIAVIPNGYEPGEPDREGVRPVLDPLTIVHVGTVIERNRPDLFFSAVRDLHRGGRLGVVRLRFVGNLSRDYLRRMGLDSVVESTGLVSREAARQEMAAAPVLLLLVGDYVARWGCNAKLYEYIRSGRPIVCLEQSSASNDASLLRQFAAERSFFGRLDNTASIASAIDAARRHIRENPTANPALAPAFVRYSRESLAGQLAAFLDGLD
jgi:glycosyltransferase involved in cell wall biosynthesis